LQFGSRYKYKDTAIIELLFDGVGVHLRLVSSCGAPNKKKQMKAVYFIIAGVVTWFVLSVSKSLWVYQTKAHIGAVVMIGLASIIWLTNQENRKRLRKGFSSRGFNENTLERVKTIKVMVIAIFSFLAVVIEIGKAFIRQSEGFSYVKSELLKSTAITAQVGQIEYIAVGNRFSIGQSFKDSEKRLKTEIIIFGNLGQIDAEVEAIKTDIWKIRDIRINHN
jgi:hypothetical protein